MALKIRKVLYGAVSQEVVDVLLKLGVLCVAEDLSHEAETILFECLLLESELYRSLDTNVDKDEYIDSTNSSEVIVFHLKGAAVDGGTAAPAPARAIFALQDVQPTVAETVNLLASNFKAKAQ